MFIPNFTNAIDDWELTIQETQQIQDTISEPSSEEVTQTQDLQPVAQDAITTPENTVVATEPSTEPSIEATIDTWASISDVLWNISFDGSNPSVSPEPTTPVTTDVLPGIGSITEDVTHDSAVPQTGEQQPTIDQYIDDGYFSLAFTKGSYDIKILDLQNILKQFWLFAGQVNGIYDDVTIASVYQYQLSHGLINSSDSAALKGFFGPKTRSAFNKEYVTYKQNLLNGISQISKNTNGGSSSSSARTIYMEKIKSYFFDNKYSLENIFGTGVFVGNSDIDFALLSGTIDLPLIFQSNNTLDGNIAEVTFDEGTILKTENGDIFTGNLASPEFLDTSVAEELTGQKILSVLDVWGNDENKIFLEDANGSKVSSKIKMPVPGQAEWTILTVSYSNDWDTWFSMENQTVFLENGEPYVEFETTHFTIFSIGLPIWSFFINKNDFSTSTVAVTLTSNISGATQMRFANTAAGLTSASWVTYNASYAWSIAAVDWYQTVYAEFAGTYGNQTIQDTIFLDRTNLSANLLVSIQGNMNATTVLDSTTNAYNFTALWSLPSVSLSGEQTLSFNGTSQYAERTSIGVSAYPFTFSAWVNTDTIAGTDSIVMMGNSATTTTYFGLQLVSGKPGLIATNTTATATTSPATLVPWRWYHVVGVFTSATSRTLYVNGDKHWSSATSVTFINTNQQLRIGRYVATSTNYFDGAIDDVRIYNKALTATEVTTIFNSHTKIDPPVQYLNDGEFTVNNGAYNAYTTTATLNSSVVGATQMRFANTEAGLTSASWVTYNASYAWTLDSVLGNKMVYAQYITPNGTFNAQDSIFLDTVADANLRVLLAWNMSATTVLDSTANALSFNSFWTMTNPTISGDQVLSFNGTSQYIERADMALTAYPFTFAAWINTDTIAGTDAIIQIGNSATTTTYYGIQLLNWAPSIVARNTTAYTATSAHVISPWTWYHVVGVFTSATSRTLYVNGVQEGTNATSTTFVNTNQQVRVGRYVGASTNYFDGYIDDTRIYNKALTAAEITTLYQNRATRPLGPTATITYSTTGATAGPVVATIGWFSENGTTILNNWGLNTYTFTQNGSFTFMFKDADGNIGSSIAYVDWITPPTGTVSISWPTSLAFGSTAVTAATNSLEKTFNGAWEYFQIADTLGADAGYYTTLSFSDLQYNSYTISKNLVYVKTLAWVSLISGTANASVTSSIWSSYVNASSPLTFIMRSAWANWGKTGTYGAQVAIRVDIPAFQQPWTYAWTIIYTLY